MTDELHEAERHVLQFADYANVCGCGNSDVFWKELAEGLNAIRDLDGALDGDDAAYERQQAWIDGHYFATVAMDGWKLLDHGSSIYGSWLTDSGRRLRDALRLAGFDVDSHTWYDREHELFPVPRVADGEASVGTWKVST